MKLINEKASGVILHFANEESRKAESERHWPLHGQIDVVGMLRDVKFELMGRHVLCEKDFTKGRNGGRG